MRLHQLLNFQGQKKKFMRKRKVRNPVILFVLFEVALIVSSSTGYSSDVLSKKSEFLYQTPPDNRVVDIKTE